MISGGLSEPREATSEIQEYVDRVKPQFEDRINFSYSEFRAVAYRTQIVDGMNYFVSVATNSSSGEFVFLKIFKSLPSSGGGLSVTGYQTGKSASDEITFF
jgi:cystatin-A/B